MKMRLTGLAKLPAIACAAGALALAMSGAAEACSAVSVVAEARNNANSDLARAARDVATEFVDHEGWTKDALTIDAGAGTLLVDKTPDVEGTVEGLRSFMDSKSKNPHGRAAGTGEYDDTVRGHMRQHIWEWDQVLQGKTVEFEGRTLNWAAEGLGWIPKPATSGAPADVASPAPPSDPSPAAEPEPTAFESPAGEPADEESPLPAYSPVPIQTAPAASDPNRPLAPSELVPRGIEGVEGTPAPASGPVLAPAPLDARAG